MKLAHYILLFFLLIFPLSAWCDNDISDAEDQQLREIATQWMADVCDLTDEDYVNLWSDEAVALYVNRARNKQSFVIVARQEYLPYMSNPVLAYGDETRLRTGDLFKTPWGNFIAYCNESLKRIKRKSSKEECTTFEQLIIPPLLGNIQWNQDDPYNAVFMYKAGKKAIVGCGPIAFGQIMKYYEYPKRAKGECYFNENGRESKLDFYDYVIPWDSIPATFNGVYGNRDEIAKRATHISQFLLVLGMTFNVKYKKERSSTKISNVFEPMVTNWDYSPQMTFVYEDLTQRGILTNALRELKAGRPFVVSSSYNKNSSHLFVCDGYQDGFLHLNMGWGGNGNGYVRAMIAKHEQEPYFRYIITKVMPRDKDAQKVDENHKKK